MFDQLKEIELLRYNINTNIERVSEKITKEYLDSTNDTISALIATGFSLIAGNLGDSIYSFLRRIPFIDSIVNKMSDIALRHLFGIGVKSVLTVAVFLLLFLVSFNIAKHYRAKHVAKKRANELERLVESDYKKLIDDFDHIACDALLFSQYFLDNMISGNGENGSEDSDQQKIFKLYEAMYYLGKAQSITETILDNKEKCVDSGSALKLSEHRLANAVKMMNEILVKINKEIDGGVGIKVLDENEKKSLNNTHTRIKHDMNVLNEKIKTIWKTFQ